MIRVSYLYVYCLTAVSVMLCLCACTGLSPERAAQAYVDRAAELVEQHRYEAALQQIDSVHTLYPKQVAQRRQAKALKDSSIYRHSKPCTTAIRSSNPCCPRLTNCSRSSASRRTTTTRTTATTSIAHSKPAGTPTAVSCKPMSPTTAKRFSRVITTAPNRYTRLR